jgi:ring-1,2-phenylacetyl-CoA epoxidase subunit PaaE
VADVRRETAEAVSIAFAVPDALRDAYRFAAGQNLTLKATLGGEEIRRCYSICSGVDDGELRVAVKRQEGGVFSGFCNARLKRGDLVDVMTPAGNFSVPLDAADARVYLGIAAGSGITPLISLLKTVLKREPLSRFFLLYGNRTTQSIMFREALEDLKDCHLGRFSLAHVLSREAQDVPALSGHIDADKIALFLRGVVAAARVDHAFLCGPAGLIETAEPALERLGVPRERIHVERFTIDGGPAKPRSAQPESACAAAIVAEAEAMRDGIRHRFPISEGQSIIEAAESAGLDLPYSCRGGMCCTCRAKLVAGEVEMAVNYSLEAWELAAGYVLTCQSRPRTATVVLDYDAV